MSLRCSIRIDALCEAYGDGKSFDEIAGEIGVGRSSVVDEWNRLQEEAAGCTPDSVAALCDFLADGGELEAMESSAWAAFARIRRAIGEQAR